jgi:hypothetical protein
MNRLLPLAIAAWLAACATQDERKLADAAVTPLSDLNLVNAPIAEVPRAAQRAPYAAPADTDCPTLMAQVRALDEVPGPDLALARAC